MIMADVLKFVFLILGVLLVYISYWLAATALFPALVERTSHQYQTHPVKITLMGLLMLLPLAGLGALIGHPAHPVAKAASVVMYGVPALLGLLGSAGLSQRIGSGLPSAIDELHPWRRELRGGIVLSLTFLLPFIGWFVVMPWAIVSGLGAVVVCLTRKERQNESVPALEAVKEPA